MSGKAAEKTPNDGTEPNKPPQTEPVPPNPDKLLAQQLQAELESRRSLTAAAEVEIGRCWEAYKKATNIILAVLAIAAATGTFLGLKTRSDVIAAARSAAASEVDKVRVEVRAEIERQFEKDNIKKMVFDAAKERIDTVAEPMIRSNISAQISPLRKELLVTVADAKKGVDRLEEVTAFAVTVVLADHDDRAAYERLKRSVEDPAAKDRDAAMTAQRSIQARYSLPERAWTPVPWETIPDGTNRYSWDMDRIAAIWNTLPAFWAKDFVDFAWSCTNITEEQRRSFARNVCLRDSRNSLQAADTAAEKLAGALGARHSPPFDYSDIERKWGFYWKTNHLFTASAGEPTNTVYDILLPSTEDRAVVVRDRGETKFLLFKLRYPAVAGSIQGKCFDYPRSSVADAKLAPGSYLNAVWAHWNGWKPEDVKLEFKYTRDLSATNVQTVNIATNSIILDGSFHIPIK